MGSLGRGARCAAIALVAVMATATTASAQSVSASPTSVDFGTVAVGATSEPKTVTWTNHENVPLPVGALVQPESYAIEDTCPAELAPAASCTTTVRYTPANAGIHRRTLSRSFSTGETSQTVEVALVGRAPRPPRQPPSTAPRPPRPAAAYHLSRTKLSFGNARYRRTTKPLSVILTNVGSGSGGTLRPSLAAGHVGDFQIVASTCTGKRLAPNESCSVSVVAIPKARRERRAELRFFSGAAGPRVTVAVYGLRSKKAKRKAPPVRKRGPVDATPSG